MKAKLLFLRFAPGPNAVNRLDYQECRVRMGKNSFLFLALQDSIFQSEHALQ